MTSLQIMLAELESSRLEVVLVPSKRHTNEGGMIRVAASRNCNWYRRFCLSHPSSRKRNHRKPDTRIRRKDIVRILTRMTNGLPTRSKYANELRKIAAHAS